ncbi:MAG: cell division protein FtsL [Lachnospiraceae bacterium]|nr:cell division protein FtsL [Lachnospiraceae bacterium]
MGRRVNRRSRASVFGRSNNSIYIDGNTVRRVEPRFGERKPGKTPLTGRHTDVIRIPQVSFGYYLFFFVALAITAFVCIGYVRIHSDITASKKRVSSLESTLSQLKLANDEEYERIAGSIDLEEIKKTAMTDLNMRYPDESQVVRVSMESDDYVRQYGSIPEDPK